MTGEFQAAQSETNEVSEEDALEALLDAGADNFKEVREANQERQSEQATTIEILEAYYGGQQFYWHPHVGTFSDIVAMCPAVTAVISQGPEAVKGFLAGYQITDEQAEVIRNPKPDEADSEDKDERNNDTGTNNEDDITKLVAEAKNIDRQVSRRYVSDDAKESLITMKGAAHEMQSAPLPVESAPEMPRDIEVKAAEVVSDGGAAIVVVEEKVNEPVVEDSRGAANTITHVVKPSTEIQQSIEATKPDIIQKQESDGTEARPPVVLDQMQKIDREVGAISKDVDEEHAPKNDPTPLPLSDILEKEHVAERATPAEIASAMVPVQEVHDDIEDAVEVYHLPVPDVEDETDHVYMDEEIELMSQDSEVYDDVIEDDAAVDLEVATPAMVSDSAEAIDPVESEITQVFHKIQSMEAELDTNLPTAETDNLEIEMPEEVSSVLEEYVEMLPEINQPVEVMRVKQRIAAVAHAIDILQTSTTAEECRDSLDMLHNELVALLEMLGYEDGHAAATHIVERWKYDIKTLRQFIAALAKVVIAQESHQHRTTRVKHHRHHTFGRNVVSMLVHAVPFKRQLQTA